MLTFETIITLIVAAAPSLIAIISIISAMIKLIAAGKTNSDEVIDKLEETTKAVLDTKEYETLKLELQMAHAENRAIKKQINELLTKIDRIVREEE
jgi:tripartite-type tricarboxylate transporter receptor subunit TctC